MILKTGGGSRIDVSLLAFARKGGYTFNHRSLASYRCTRGAGRGRRRECSIRECVYHRARALNRPSDYLTISLRVTNLQVQTRLNQFPSPPLEVNTFVIFRATGATETVYRAWFVIMGRIIWFPPSCFRAFPSSDRGLILSQLVCTRANCHFDSRIEIKR